MSVTVVALVVLTLGIGASTAIFSVVDAVVLRALPFDEHDRVVAVGERRAPGPTVDPARDPLQLSSIAPAELPLLVAAGLLIGAAGAWCTSAAAESFLFRIEAKDPRAFFAALMALGLAGIVASAIPARRAASVDPMVALRGE